MREIVFRVISERPGHLAARADEPLISITAPTLEELHHEARQALIDKLGETHGAYRVRIRRPARPATTAAAAAKFPGHRQPPAYC